MAEFIHELRKEKGMTQKQLAEKLNITDKAVSKWERGLGCPDISLLSSLADILGVTVTELLNGERSDVKPLEADSIAKTTLKYASKSILNKKESLKNITKILITGSCMLAIIICIICDIAISGALTWSLYPTAAIIFGWLIIIPMLQLKKNNFRMSLISASVFIIPFLFVIDKIMGSTEELILPIGMPVSLTVMAYIWTVYFMISNRKISKWNIAAISVLLTIPVSLIINSITNILTNQPMISIWNILSFAITGALSVKLFSIAKKRNTRDSSTKTI
jgi:transcriptional regulator with XRE-family HTH domain